MEKLTNREIDLLDRALDTKAVYTEDYTSEEISKIGRKLKGYRPKQYRMKTLDELISEGAVLVVDNFERSSEINLHGCTIDSFNYAEQFFSKQIYDKSGPFRIEVTE